MQRQPQQFNEYADRNVSTHLASSKNVVNWVKKRRLLAVVAAMGYVFPLTNTATLKGSPPNFSSYRSQPLINYARAQWNVIRNLF